MDLSKVVEYDEAFPVEIKHRSTGEPVGLTIHVVSFDSVDAQKAERKVQAVKMREQFKAAEKGADPTAIDFTEVQYDALVAKAIAAVKAWEWADGLTWNGNAPPKCDDAGKRDVLLHPNAGWILDQVINAGSRIENFLGK